jgi:putative oxidoreductase
MKTPFLLGRLAFGGFFLYNGINHFRNYKQMAGYAGSKGVPKPEAAVLGSGALLTIGGASILLGAKPKIGSLAILAFLAGVSPKMHDFWNEQDPMQKQNSMIHFMKNMALLGGALALMGVEEPWPASIQRGEAARADEDEDTPVQRLSEKRRRLAEAA